MRLIAWATLAIAALMWCTTVPVMAAGVNLVTNPSGAGGTTTGWFTGRASDTVSAVTIDGHPWLRFQSPSGLYDWAVYKFAPAELNAGQEYTCGFEAMGNGTVFAMFYDGQKLHDGVARALTNTPQIFEESATISGIQNAPPEIQVRNNTGPVDVFFNEVTCVLGSSVAIPLETATLSSSTIAALSSTAQSSSAAATPSTASSAPSAPTKAVTIPATGSGKLIPFGGAALTLVGLLLGLWVQRWVRPNR